jgi:hypothetical protein
MVVFCRLLNVVKEIQMETTWFTWEMSSCNLNHFFQSTLDVELGYLIYIRVKNDSLRHNQYLKCGNVATSGVSALSTFHKVILWVVKIQ